MTIGDGKTRVRKRLRRAGTAVVVPLLLAAGVVTLPPPTRGTMPPGRHEAAEQEAQDLFNHFTEKRRFSSTERHALWRLSAAPENVRKAFFDGRGNPGSTASGQGRERTD